MKNLLKIIIIIAVSVPTFYFSRQTEADATCPFPGCFDGVARGQIYCTCSNNFLIYFAPLNFYGIPESLAGGLVFEPGSMKYLNYDIVPSVGVVGTYMPGVEACWMHTSTTCVPIPNYGLILPDTGSSLPGGGDI